MRLDCDACLLHRIPPQPCVSCAVCIARWLILQRHRTTGNVGMARQQQQQQLRALPLLCRFSACGLATASLAQRRTLGELSKHVGTACADQTRAISAS